MTHQFTNAFKLTEQYIAAQIPTPYCSAGNCKHSKNCCTYKGQILNRKIIIVNKLNVVNQSANAAY